MASSAQPEKVIALLVSFKNSTLAPQIAQLEKAIEGLGWKVMTVEIATTSPNTTKLDWKEAITRAKGQRCTPDTKIIIYYGGSAYSPSDVESNQGAFYGAPKQEWICHGNPNQPTCTYHIPAINPREHIVPLLTDFPNDILFIFHAPFALAKADYFQAGFVDPPFSRRTRNVQLLILGQEQFSSLGADWCMECHPTSKKIALKIPTGPDPFEIPGGLSSKGKEREPKQTEDLAAQLSALAGREKGVSVGELAQTINGLSNMHHTKVVRILGWEHNFLLKKA